MRLGCGNGTYILKIVDKIVAVVVVALYVAWNGLARINIVDRWEVSFLQRRLP